MSKIQPTKTGEGSENFHLLAENSDYCIFIADKNNKIVYINKEGVKMLGAKNESEILGQGKYTFICKYKNTDSKPHFSEGEITKLNGKVIDVKIKDIKINYACKNCTLSIIANITRIKEDKRKLVKQMADLEILTDDLKKFQLAVESAHDLIVITDPNGVIVFANKASEEMTGYKREEIIGKTPALWRGNMDHEEYQMMWETIEKNKLPYIACVQGQKKDGEKFIADIHISPIIDDSTKKILYFVAIERDITKQKEIDRAKTEFVSLASHQLRTPLASISLSAELLLRGITGEIDSKQKKFIEEIFNSTKRMSSLIDSLLSISRIELGTFVIKPEAIDITESASKILDEMLLQIKDKNIKLNRNFEEIPIIEFDENILRIVIENLVTNAIKYTSNKGKVDISISQNTKDIVIKVKDNGCGIPPEQQKKIFTKLFRADNAHEIDTAGTGLGLYIAKSILEKVDSKIWFKSQINKGSTFYVSIPIKNS